MQNIAKQNYPGFSRLVQHLAMEILCRILLLTRGLYDWCS